MNNQQSNVGESQKRIPILQWIILLMSLVIGYFLWDLASLTSRCFGPKCPQYAGFEGWPKILTTLFAATGVASLWGARRRQMWVKIFNAWVLGTFVLLLVALLFGY